MGWLLHVLGIDNVAGRWYGWWSGSGSVILPPLITLAGVAVLWGWHHQCHVKRCYRIARFPVPGTTWTTCRRHHPQDAPTHGDVLASQERRT